MRYNPIAQTVLALETSCDESAVAIVRLEDGRLDLLANFIVSQMSEHAQWGGVVPEIASRRHLEALPSLVGKALVQARYEMTDIDLSLKQI